METVKGLVTEKITESIRDLESLTITLPLGNPNLKLVHTNQFIWTELPSDVFKLDNMGLLAKNLNSKYTRYTNYEENKWYIEGVTINNDGNSATIELELNPFASSLTQYKDDRYNFENSYTQAYQQNNTTTNNDSSTKVSSVNSKENNTLALGQGKTINNLVKKIVGKTTDEYKKLKKIHNWGQKYITYDGYECSRYGCNPVKAYKNRKHLNCGDTSVLMHALYSAAGLKCYINHGNYHFWNIVTANGKKYASDCSGTHGLNSVWSTSSHPNKPFRGSKANPKAICG